MVELKWLGAKADNVTWGLPWAKGSVSETDRFVLRNGENYTPVQTKPTAYWDDGSVKWTLHSAVLDNPENRLSLERGSICADTKIKIHETPGHIFVNTGAMHVMLNKHGVDFIKHICVGDRERVSGGRLVVLNENRFKTDGYESTVTEKYDSNILEVKIEEDGPVRAVVRIKGNHIGRNNRSRNGAPRFWLPFTMRLYFYAGSDEIKITHTFLFDGQQNTDFIKGIGLEFDVNLRGELYNRHVRFTGESGVYADSPKSLLTLRTTGKYHDMYKEQTKCENICFDCDEDERFLGLLDESAVWSDFKITQLSSEEYNISKRTGAECVYIKGNMGKRAMGSGFLSDSDGGFGVHLSKFWEKYPSAIEFYNTSSARATAMVWLWSPDAQAMDLRHYDTRTHVYSAYEGFEEMRATPYGIANTNEVCIKTTASYISNEKLVEWTKTKNRPVLLIAENAGYYNSTDVLGIWSLPDRSTPKKEAIENHLDDIIEFYKRETETRRWYGFWDYGDFMHSYDSVHHCWKYDMGGQAWQNTELVPNMWLWYSFLRTGREDIYIMAENMTRHTSEVDVYHIGEYARLGSRHNVVHWGCGCKESRISMAGLHKYYYFLTGDERTGDIMDEVVDADFAVGELDPMRAYHAPDSRFKTHVRFGPDVLSFCSNWFTYWERHRSEKYRSKLLKTLDFFKQGHRFVLSGVYGYNPENTEYIDFKVEGGSHFMFCFGSLYVWLEIANALGDDEMKERLMDLGQFYGSNEADVKFRHDKCKEWGYPELADKRFKSTAYNVGISAYSAKCRGNDALAKEICETVMNDIWLDMPLVHKEIDSVDCHKKLTETLGIGTNAVGQWGTNVIMALALIGDLFE